jgi:hypothetical protein
MTPRSVRAEIASPSRDLFDARVSPSGACVDVLTGLNALMQRAPLWPIRADRWASIVNECQRFADRHHATAVAAGWHPVALFGMSPRAPHARLEMLGAGWLIAVAGHHVLDVTRTEISLRTISGARLQIPRREPHPDAVLPWESAP